MIRRDRLRRRLPPALDPAVLLGRIGQPRIPDFQNPFQHAPPQIHANLQGLALAVFKALGSEWTFVVLNLNELDDAAINRIPDLRAKLRNIGSAIALDVALLQTALRERRRQPLRAEK